MYTILMEFPNWPLPSFQLLLVASACKKATNPSILSLKNHHFTVLRSARKKKTCCGEQREEKCQCLKKKNALIESESTSASGWMSKGVIGDWLQIMNNYIKVGRLPARVYACVCVRMCEEFVFLCTGRCRGVCSLLRQSFGVFVCACVCVWAV